MRHVIESPISSKQTLNQTSMYFQVKQALLLVVAAEEGIKQDLKEGLSKKEEAMLSCHSCK